MNKYNKFTICKLIVRYLTVIISFVLITKVINNNKKCLCDGHILIYYTHILYNEVNEA